MFKILIFIILLVPLLLIFALIYLPYKLKTLMGIRDQKQSDRKKKERNVNNAQELNRIKNEDIIDADFEELDSSDDK